MGVDQTIESITLRKSDKFTSAKADGKIAALLTKCTWYTCGTMLLLTRWCSSPDIV
jgi:hypothetical protein